MYRVRERDYLTFDLFPYLVALTDLSLDLSWVVKSNKVYQ